MVFEPVLERLIYAKSLKRMVLQERIELSTFPLPNESSAVYINKSNIYKHFSDCHTILIPRLSQRLVLRPFSMVFIYGGEQL
jgi:hypothetical protein